VWLKKEDASEPAMALGALRRTISQNVVHHLTIHIKQQQIRFPEFRIKMVKHKIFIVQLAHLQILEKWNHISMD
jgi:hypothetical protein